MEYKKRIIIKNKIIEKNDLIKIINEIYEKKEKEDEKINITIYFDDGFEIKDNSVDILSSDYLTEKNINEIEISYKNENYKKSVGIYINGSKYLDSYINIISDDKNWFMSLYKSIEEKIDSIKKQNIIGIILNNSNISIALSATLTFLSVFIVAYFEIFDFKGFSSFQFFIYYIPILYINNFIINKIALLYPIIEFNFGNKKNLKNKKIKEGLVWLISILFMQIIIPYLIKLIL